MYYVVTGAAGFIGANLVRALNERGMTDIIAVDDLAHGDKFVNLADCEIADYLDKDVFLDTLEHGALNGAIEVVLHQGACSDTTERDGRYMMRNNYEYSKSLLDFCTVEEVPYIYASSAAVYGSRAGFRENPESEASLNIYGVLKLLFDQVVRRRAAERNTQVVGLRYFNVYGEREQHKGRMASVAYHFFNQYRDVGHVKLFEGTGGYGDGEQRRDFVSVEDVVKVNLFFLDHPDASGVFNVGTGAAQSFNEIAVATINACREARGEARLNLAELQQQGIIRYIPFPQDLEGKYQNYTQADLSSLRAAGYTAPFLTVEEGVRRYCERLMRGRLRMTSVKTLEDFVGNTPLVRLKRLPGKTSNVVLAKLEGNNPAGSVKDRPALSMIRRAQERGDIKPGDTLIEPTSGNTGIALAMCAAMMGYRMILVMPEHLSLERRQSMAAFGAEFVLTPREGGMEMARDIAEKMRDEGRGVILDQFANPDNPLSHYESTGPEIWRDTDGRLTHFVSSMGTTGTIMGVSKYLKERNPAIQIVGCQPDEGSQIPGIRKWPAAYLPKICDWSRVDRVIEVTQYDAEEMTRRLAREEGIFAGISSGGALWAALEVSKSTENAVIVFIVCDRGDRYLSTGVFPA